MADKKDDRVSYQYGRDPSVNRLERPCPKRKVNLFAEISEDEESDSSSSVRSDSRKIDTASVYLRLRPSARTSSQYSIDENVLKTRCESNIGCAGAEKHFTFSSIFRDTTSQSQIYDNCVHAAIEGEENLTVLTYGTSGSGKTFTLMGARQKSPGIIPRAIEHIFTKHSQSICANPGIKVEKGNVVILEDENMRTEDRLRCSSLASGEPLPNYYESQTINVHNEHKFSVIESPNDLVFIWVSYAEIYNECVYDLLRVNSEQNSNMQNGVHKENRKALKVISNDGNAFIKDLTSVHVRSSSEAFRLLISGQTRVSYASTNINANSSRSHCIFFIDVIRFKQSSELIHTTFKFCDLAGSERLKKTDNIGNRLKEAQSINNSLMVLGRCLDAVYHKNSIVPFRDSKLTILLQAPLMGKEKITMIVNMMPTAEFYEENLNVLNFASMARQIVYKLPSVAQKAVRSTRFSWFNSNANGSSSPMAMGNNSQVSILLDENERLKEEIEVLQNVLKERMKAAEQTKLEIRRELCDNFEKHSQKSNSLWQRRLDLKEGSLKTNHEFALNQLRKEYDVKIKEIENREMQLQKRIEELEKLIQDSTVRKPAQIKTNFSL